MFLWILRFCILEKHILSLVENHPSFPTTTSSVYLAIDNFNGNINCDVVGPIRNLYLLELKWTSLVVFLDAKQLYGKVAGFLKQTRRRHPYFGLFLCQTLYITIQRTAKGTYTEKISVCMSAVVIVLHVCTLSTYRHQDKDECFYIWKVFKDREFKYWYDLISKIIVKKISNAI